MKTINKSSCLICGDNPLSIENSVDVFQDKLNFTNDISVHVVLSNILDTEIKLETSRSQVVCSKCYKLIDEYDELQNRVSEIKSEISESYVNTLNKFEECVEFDEAHTIEIHEDVEHVDSEKEELECPLESTKKILDIPSSDDEGNAEVLLSNDQMAIQSIEDIEIELVKMHQENDESTVLVLENSNQAFSTFVDNNSESDTETAENVEIESVAQLRGDKNNIMNIKVEPSHEDSTLHAPQSSSDNKPNILRKKALSHTNSNGQNFILEEVSKRSFDLADVPVVSRNDSIYTCLLCDGDTSAVGQSKPMIAHMKEVHDIRLYICDVCGEDFRKRNVLSAHLDEHIAAEEGDFQCEICNRILPNLRLFRIHRRMHYPQHKSWTCETCGKRYSSKNLLDEHVNSHLGVRPHVCPICNKSFSSKYTFRAHEKIHEMRPRPYKCSQCPKTFLSQQNLNQHEGTHSVKKEFACHLCQKQFSSSHNLEVHSIVHTGYKPFMCRLCGKAFARKAEIRDHERTHTGERPYQCEFCGSTFSQRSNLQSHKRATHYNDKPYNCEECGRQFKRRRLLDYHIKAVHTGERPYKCEKCEATFVYPEHFKKHRRTHTGEKPYGCEVCGKAFNSRDNRNAHRFIHSDKKPYECLVCGAGFMRKPLLYHHMQQQGHLNDTIVVNQPRLTTDDDQIVTVDAEGTMELLDTDSSNSKLFIQNEDGSQHIIIGEPIEFSETMSEGDNNETEIVDEEEMDQDLESTTVCGEIITTDGGYGETQIVDTIDGPLQLVKVSIANENGEEEEAWIKILPE